jgi:hypothetical protein
MKLQMGNGVRILLQKPSRVKDDEWQLEETKKFLRPPSNKNSFYYFFLWLTLKKKENP